MSFLQQKRIILGITGSIASYKAAILTRLLVKAGADVKVIMTESAKQFISPLTLSTLSKNPVSYEIMDEDTWSNHVELGLWADYFIIAPTTANSLSKLADGHADNLLMAVYLSARCPVLIAPAMDVDMWHHESTKSNIRTLQNNGDTIIPVGKGELASGLSGEGRMAEPEEIVKFLEKMIQDQLTMFGVKVLVTAGPTHEKIDPVRFIGNPSSGKMGIAIAEQLAGRGAEVILVLGPTHLKPEVQNILVIPVISAEAMYNAVMDHYQSSKVIIMAAAVADYTPVDQLDQKIKKTDGSLSIELKRTLDIAAVVGRDKMQGQIHIGFALETQNELENAYNKAIKKNFDFIVLNSLNEAGAGFQHDTNRVTFIDQNNNQKHFELKSKKEVAIDIVDKIEALLP